MKKSNRELLEELGIDLRTIRESGKVKCPQCGPTRRNKNDPSLSVKITEGLYKCHNCDWHGAVFSEPLPYVKPEKEYKRPAFNNRTELPEKAVKWFMGRGINQQTLIDTRITFGPEWMPQVFGAELRKLMDGGLSEEQAKPLAHEKAKVNTFQFNYFRKGELINVKYRDGLKNFKLVKDAEKIFYGYDDVLESDWCVIVEGEIDKLSYWEAGIRPVISVPNGAINSERPEEAALDYLDNCWELFTNKTRIILATDDDLPGHTLRDELARRLGIERCFKVDLGDCKDANEFLIAYGPEKLAATVAPENVFAFPIEGIITADMLYDELDLILENGLQRGELLEIRELDKYLSWVAGQLCMVTGIPNHGKSPFVLMICCILAVKKGWKFGFFTPETRPLALFLIKTIEQLIGKRVGKSMKQAEKDQAKAFVNQHFFLINPDDYTLENILTKAEQLVVVHGIRGLVIDPWNKLEHKQPQGTSETNYISQALDIIIKFADRKNVLTFLVAHPAKMRKGKDGLFEVPNLYDIAGSANFFNKCDIGIAVYRNYQTGKTEIHVQKMKYDHLGSTTSAYPIELQWNMNNGRLCSPSGWDNTNWLEEPPKQATLDFGEPPAPEGYDQEFPPVPVAGPDDEIAPF